MEPSGPVQSCTGYCFTFTCKTSRNVHEFYYHIPWPIYVSSSKQPKLCNEFQGKVCDNSHWHEHIFKNSTTKTPTLRFTWIWWGGDELCRNTTFPHTECCNERTDVRVPAGHEFQRQHGALDAFTTGRYLPIQRTSFRLPVRQTGKCTCGLCFP